MGRRSNVIHLFLSLVEMEVSRQRQPRTGAAGRPRDQEWRSPASTVVPVPAGHAALREASGAWGYHSPHPRAPPQPGLAVLAKRWATRAQRDWKIPEGTLPSSAWSWAAALGHPAPGVAGSEGCRAPGRRAGRRAVGVPLGQRGPWVLGRRGLRGRRPQGRGDVSGLCGWGGVCQLRSNLQTALGTQRRWLTCPEAGEVLSLPPPGVLVWKLGSCFGDLTGWGWGGGGPTGFLSPSCRDRRRRRWGTG